MDLGILISGRGSNLGAIVRAVQEKRLDARIRVVVSNRPAAAGLDVVSGAGVATAVLDHDEHSDRASFGLHAQPQALEYGARIAGVTVHFVDEQMDHRPVIAQAAIAVADDDTEQTLSERLLAKEHRLHPLALQRLALGGLSVVGRRVIGGLP